MADFTFAWVPDDTSVYRLVQMLDPTTVNPSRAIKVESKAASKTFGKAAEVLEQAFVQDLDMDSFDLQDVDFIKIDTEGYELFVVRGAEQTIKRCRPTMIVEQKGHGMQYFGFRKEEAVELLETWGMKRVKVMSGDWIMVW